MIIPNKHDTDFEEKRDQQPANPTYETSHKSRLQPGLADSQS